MSDCGRGCNQPITVTTGAQGDDGTSSVLSTGVFAGTAVVHYVYTANRLYTSSDDIYNGGSGYSWSIMTVPAVPASNVAMISVSAQINATDVHTVTATLLVGGAPVANVTAIQSCGLRESMTFQFQTSALTESSAIAIKLVSDGAAVTPVLKAGNVVVNIYG